MNGLCPYHKTLWMSHAHHIVSILAQANLESWATECDSNYLKWYRLLVRVHIDQFAIGIPEICCISAVVPYRRF
jgi:hypothetical protein